MRRVAVLLSVILTVAFCFAATVSAAGEGLSSNTKKLLSKPACSALESMAANTRPDKKQLEDDLAAALSGLSSLEYAQGIIDACSIKENTSDNDLTARAVSLAKEADCASEGSLISKFCAADPGIFERQVCTEAKQAFRALTDAAVLCFVLAYEEGSGKKTLSNFAAAIEEAAEGFTDDEADAQITVGDDTFTAYRLSLHEGTEKYFAASVPLRTLAASEPQSVVNGLRIVRDKDELAKLTELAAGKGICGWIDSASGIKELAGAKDVWLDNAVYKRDADSAWKTGSLLSGAQYDMRKEASLAGKVLLIYCDDRASTPENSKGSITLADGMRLTEVSGASVVHVTGKAEMSGVFKNTSVILEDGAELELRGASIIAGKGAAVTAMGDSSIKVYGTCTLQGAKGAQGLLVSKGECGISGSGALTAKAKGRNGVVVEDGALTVNGMVFEACGGIYSASEARLEIKSCTVFADSAEGDWDISGSGVIADSMLYLAGSLVSPDIALSNCRLAYGDACRIEIETAPGAASVTDGKATLLIDGREIDVPAGALNGKGYVSCFTDKGKLPESIGIKVTGGSWRPLAVTCTSSADRFVNKKVFYICSTLEPGKEYIFNGTERVCRLSIETGDERNAGAAGQLDIILEYDDGTVGFTDIGEYIDDAEAAFSSGGSMYVDFLAPSGKLKSLKAKNSGSDAWMLKSASIRELQSDGEDSTFDIRQWLSGGEECKFYTDGTATQYDIEITTAARSGAGTNSDIRMSISAKDTQPVELCRVSDYVSNAFRRGETNCLRVIHDASEPVELTLRNDWNGTEDSEWYCDTVRIRPYAAFEPKGAYVLFEVKNWIYESEKMTVKAAGYSIGTPENPCAEVDKELLANTAKHAEEMGYKTVELVLSPGVSLSPDIADIVKGLPLTLKVDVAEYGAVTHSWQFNADSLSRIHEPVSLDVVISGAEEKGYDFGGPSAVVLEVAASDSCADAKLLLPVDGRFEDGQVLDCYEYEDGSYRLAGRGLVVKKGEVAVSLSGGSTYVLAKSDPETEKAASAGAPWTLIAACAALAAIAALLTILMIRRKRRCG